MKVRCGSCEAEFEAQRSTARYCTATCRQRAGRERKAAAESVASDARAGKAEHALVRATRIELSTLDMLETFDGQLALQLARKMTNPDESGATALSKEIRSLMADVRKAAPAKPDAGADAAPVVEPVEDEVERARRQRAESRQAAGLA